MLQCSHTGHTRDAVGKVSRSYADFGVAATAASRWILAFTTSRWILAATTSSRPSRSEFQHSSPTLEPRILTVAAGISN
jgi:hypothetical protein